MAYFTERNGMGETINRSSDITYEMYSYLLDCCERYLIHIAWKFPVECPDGYGIYDVDRERFSASLTFEIPSLFRDSFNRIAAPRINDDFNQYALLDYIEFLSQNFRDIASGNWHSFFHHRDLAFSGYSNIFNSFRKDINTAFEKTGLLFRLSDNKEVERVIEYDTLSDDINAIINLIPEDGTKKLLNEAIILFRKPDPNNRSVAVEKMWDAFERLKTFYIPTLDKKTSTAKIISDMANSQDVFIDLFNTEFLALTKIGNDFRIRHHEKGKIDIEDIRHYDYFFNRCLALIALAVQYLK